MKSKTEPGILDGIPQGAIINPPILDLSSYLSRDVGVTSWWQTLSRMEFRVRNVSNNYEYVLASLKNMMEYKGRHREKMAKYGSTQFNEFSLGRACVQVFSWRGRWFGIRLTGQFDDGEVQTILKSVLSELPPTRVSLFQVEFALDILPKNSVGLNTLMEASSHLVLKRIKGSGFSQVLATSYQGLRGFVAEGGKGCRIYPKKLKQEDSIDEFLRIELQANKRFLNSLGLNLSSLPISPSFDIASMFDLRHGLTEQSIEKMVARVFRRRLPRMKICFAKKTSRSKTHRIKIRLRAASKSVLCALRNHILHSVLGSHLPLQNPVARQICAYKKFMKKEGIAPEVNRFFPRVSYK